jgi:hypothetical protein
MLQKIMLLCHKIFQFPRKFNNAVGVVGQSQVRTNSFLHLRSINLNPPVNCRVIDRHATAKKMLLCLLQNRLSLIAERIILAFRQLSIFQRSFVDWRAELDCSVRLSKITAVRCK